MRRGIAGFALAVMFLPLPLTAAAASPSVTRSDPMMGPNARDEARHAHDPLQLAPATSAGNPHAALPRTRARGMSIQGPAVNPAGGVDREVFGFAPYWAIANWAKWNFSL